MAMSNNKSGKLNPSQRRFVREYLKDQNATQAYLRTYGGNEKSAGASGSRLLENVKVRLAVEKGLAKLLDKANITAERNLQRIAEFAYHKKVRAADALKACELIGKTFGQFKEVTESKIEHAVQATPEQIADAVQKFKSKL